jgi:hypothetical protein
VTVVCPGMVNTPIVERMRDHIQQTDQHPNDDVLAKLDYMQAGLHTGMTPEPAAAAILAAVKANRLWVLPNGAELLPMVQADFDEMLASPSWPRDGRAPVRTQVHERSRGIHQWSS